MPAQKRNGSGFIFRPWITVKGKRIFARSYGLRAFRIPLSSLRRK
jgi:hypothetical protein